MPLLYLDCQYGIAGDMLLSALIDAGAEPAYITGHLRQLPVDPFVLGVAPVNQHGIQAKTLQLFFPRPADDAGNADDAGAAGTLGVVDDAGAIGDMNDADAAGTADAADNHVGPGRDAMAAAIDPAIFARRRTVPLALHARHPGHRRAAAILSMIDGSALPPRVKQRSRAVFDALARAEGKIHGIDPAEVHFHEVGAMDSIIDIIGVCLALESLDIDRIIASPVAVGSGKKQMAHGCYPIPAPATAELLLGIPLADFPVEGELTTPTGAAFLKSLAGEYRTLPAVTVGAIGYGAGKKRFDHPNVLRVMICDTPDNGPERETVVTLQCEVDDISGENLGYVMERLFEQQALDVYYTPVYMKKNRPGTLITALCRPEQAAALEEILLLETSTFGVRQTVHSRRVLQRRMERIATAYGDIAVKIGYRGDRIYQISPEYEQVRRAALEHHVPYDLVWEAVRHAVHARRASLHPSLSPTRGAE